MKKELANFKNKSLKDLEKEINRLRKEIAKLKLEMKINPPKDLNQLRKLRKKQAQILTIIQEKKLEEKFKKELKI